MDDTNITQVENRRTWKTEVGKVFREVFRTSDDRPVTLGDIRKFCAAAGVFGSTPPIRVWHWFHTPESAADPDKQTTNRKPLYDLRVPNEEEHEQLLAGLAALGGFPSGIDAREVDELRQLLGYERTDGFEAMAGVRAFLLVDAGTDRW